MNGEDRAMLARLEALHKTGSMHGAWADIPRLLALIAELEKTIAAYDAAYTAFAKSVVDAEGRTRSAAGDPARGMNHE